MNKNTDVIVIGSGLAGLVAALKISEFAKVTLLNKTKLKLLDILWFGEIRLQNGSFKTKMEIKSVKTYWSTV